MMPMAKVAVPFSFSRRAKKRKVRWGPIIRTRPIKKRIFPIANMALSKNINMPKVKKNAPPEQKATPTFCLSDNHMLEISVNIDVQCFLDLGTRLRTLFESDMFNGPRNIQNSI